jgi:hypothetical protein
LCGIAQDGRVINPLDIPCTTASPASAAWWMRDLAELKTDVRLAELTCRLRAKTAPQWHRGHPRQTQKKEMKLTASRDDHLWRAAPVHPVDPQRTGMRRLHCRDHRREPDSLALPLLRCHAGSPRSAERTDRALEIAKSHGCPLDYLEDQRQNRRALRQAHRPTPIPTIGRRSTWADRFHSCTVSMRL